MTVAAPKIRKWTRDEYLGMAERGMFEGQHVQLIEGEVIQMAPQGPGHTSVLHGVKDIIESLFSPKNWVRIQSQIDMGDSQPEPDIAVVAHDRKWYAGTHPTSALLAVEISDSSIRFDRDKAGLYASRGVQEYWIVNVAKRQVEIYRNPIPSSENEFGYRYSEKKVLSEKDIISPLARPKAKIAIKSFFE